MRSQATFRIVLLLCATWVAGACAGTGADGAPIDRRVFIDTYVELRLAALEAEDFLVSPEQRDEILASHGVDQEALLHFADVHGRDVDFMNEIWAEVERLIEDLRPNDA